MFENYADQYSELWVACSDEFPGFTRFYAHPEKLKKELILDQFLKSIRYYRKERLINRLSQTDTESEFIQNTRIFFQNAFDFNDAQLELMFSDRMVEITREFVRQARAFDPDLSFHDIFQACRNAWIMHGLQFIIGIPMELTPSILAYSLLYPYTDNLIDNPEISSLEKMIFSDRFRNRLSGYKLEPKSKTEIAVYRLVEMIENQYSRNAFPEVFESLIGIHDAQTNSLKLIQHKDSIQEDEILRICMDKGGASVLTDGFLVSGKLTEAQQYFFFGFGAYLQLLDDIQDVDEDYNAGLMTVFSKEFFSCNLDAKLNKTYWFGEQVMKNLDLFEGQHLNLFKSLMRKSMDLFIIEAIAEYPSAFSSQYVSNLEQCSPFRFSYIQKRKEQFVPYNGFLMTAVEEIASAENFRIEKRMASLIK